MAIIFRVRILNVQIFLFQNNFLSWFPVNCFGGAPGKRYKMGSLFLANFWILWRPMDLFCTI